MGALTEGFTEGWVYDPTADMGMRCYSVDLFQCELVEYGDSDCCDAALADMADELIGAPAAAALRAQACASTDLGLTFDPATGKCSTSVQYMDSMGDDAGAPVSTEVERGVCCDAALADPTMPDAALLPACGPVVNNLRFDPVINECTTADYTQDGSGAFTVVEATITAAAL